MYKSLRFKLLSALLIVSLNPAQIFALDPLRSVQPPAVIRALRSDRAGEVPCWKIQGAPLNLANLCYVSRGHFLFTAKDGEELLEILFTTGKELIYFRNPETRDVWLKMYLQADEADEKDPYFVVKSTDLQELGRVKKVTESSTNEVVYVFLNPDRRVDAKLSPFTLKEKPQQKTNWKIISYDPAATTSSAVLLGIAGIQSIFAEIMARGKTLPPDPIKPVGLLQKNPWVKDLAVVSGIGLVAGLATGAASDWFFSPAAPLTDQPADLAGPVDPVNPINPAHPANPASPASPAPGNPAIPPGGLAIPPADPDGDFDGRPEGEPLNRWDALLEDPHYRREPIVPSAPPAEVSIPAIVPAYEVIGERTWPQASNSGFVQGVARNPYAQPQQAIQHIPVQVQLRAGKMNMNGRVVRLDLRPNLRPWNGQHYRITRRAGPIGESILFEISDHYSDRRHPGSIDQQFATVDFELPDYVFEAPVREIVFSLPGSGATVTFTLPHSERGVVDRIRNWFAPN